MSLAQSDIRALLEERVKACRAKDIDWLMSLYSPNIVYFDRVPPLRGFSGSEAVRQNFIRWFKEYEGSIGLETEQLHIAASDDIAFAHMLHLDTGNVHLMKSGREGAWVRSTVCCQRSAGKWLIVHEHASWPFEFNKEGGGVVMTLSR
ncbi:MAG: nuclear transport factor 2 family protein [Caulobacteraceae bacterium]|nr:nuclear transport factor 2 family protein [Caulobacteraceae bacterium]